MNTIRKMFEHSRWANRRLLEVLAAAPTPTGKAERFMAHLLQAETVWLTRLQGRDSGHLELWPEKPVIEECIRISESNAAAYEAYLANLSDKDGDTTITYRNQSGATFETSISDILTHVALHGQYHRGQINSTLREEGLEPVNVDMIMYVRLQSGS